MKRHIRLTVIVTLVLISLPVTVFAWVPDPYFWCWIDAAAIPEGTIYVDMLLPIQESDPGYTSFHESNGQKYGISPDSEIVSYQQDGFRSYTFHIKDACGEIRPYYQYDFSVPRETYERYKELLKDYEDHCFVFRDGESRQYTMQVFRSSVEEQKINEIAGTLGISLAADRETAYTDYNTNNEIYPERQSEYDYWYCRQTYRIARFAYLDEDGKVLGVSTSVSIDPVLQEENLYIRLSGIELTTDPQHGPIWVPLIIIFTAILCGLTLAWVARKMIRK